MNLLTRILKMSNETHTFLILFSISKLRVRELITTLALLVIGRAGLKAQWYLS